MHNRRTFIRNSGMAILGGWAIPARQPSWLREAAEHPVGLQLFTLFNSIDNDVTGTLKKISGIGYREIESAFSRKGGYYGYKPKEFARVAKDAGLAWRSHHVLGAPLRVPPGGFKIPGADSTKRFTPPPMRNLKENSQELVDEAAEGGLEYLVCANIPLSNAADIQQAVEVLSKTGEACKKSGITFCYHNHIHEFEDVDGKIPYHVLLSEISGDWLKMELDLGWATVAGVDPVELFRQHPGRFPLWHVKDIDKNSKQPTEVGKGYVNFSPIFGHASAAGMKHFFVEQDGAPQPMENIADSFNYIERQHWI